MRRPQTDIPNRKKPGIRWIELIGTILLLILGAAFLTGCSGANIPASAAAQNRISQKTLEEQYGTRINLVAVTAMGGLIDVRVKVLDAEKAAQIMTDTTDAPRLIIVKTGAILNATGDTPVTRPLEDGMLYFFLYPNSGTVVAEGSQVVVDFGEVQVEPIPAVK